MRAVEAHSRSEKQSSSGWSVLPYLTRNGCDLPELPPDRPAPKRIHKMTPDSQLYQSAIRAAKRIHKARNRKKAIKAWADACRKMLGS